jgi:sucrose phosphorylase
MRTGVQLITYVDRLAGDLQGLAELLDGPLRGRFAGVHLLPFYTPIDGADAGFDPDDHRAVDPRLGTWDDVAAIAQHTEVMADLIVNHMSTRSPEFRDVVAKGADSPFAELFLTLERVFPHEASDDDLARIYRPRPGRPLTTMTFADGTEHTLWTTFTSEQVDLDVSSPRTLDHLDGLLELLAQHGVRMVRLDAVGYAVKTPGTSSFMTSETMRFIAWLTERARHHGLEVLVEVHAHWTKTLELAQAVDWSYDFALPPLVLDALHTRRSRELHHWLHIRPHNLVTVLDTHDGIGVIDVGENAGHGDGAHPGPGLLPPERIDALVESIHDATGDVSRRATGAAASNVDLYQVNTTYLDALGGDVEAMLCARALQLMLPGIPQIYYVGLLLGRNDEALLAATGVGRDVNRRYYTREQVQDALASAPVRRLLALVELRSTHPAFSGTFWLAPHEPDEPHLLTCGWRFDPARDPSSPVETPAEAQAEVMLHLDLAARTFRIVSVPDAAQA